MSTHASATKCEIPVPNRIFVGGLPAMTTEAELHALFQPYGRITATKIIVDRAGISRGYGFVTFDTKEEAEIVLKEVDGPVFKGRKLNIAQAVKKMNAAPGPDEASLARDVSREGPYQTFPVFVHQPLYLQQYHYPTSAVSSGYQHYLYASVNAPDYSSSARLHSGEYDESDVASDGGKSYSRSYTGPPSSPEYDARSPGRSNPTSPQGMFRYSCGSNMHSPGYGYPYYYYHPLYPPKSGMTLMAYPNPVMMSPPIMYVKESTATEVDAATSDVGYMSPLQSPSASGIMSPPPTPVTCEMLSNSVVESARKN